MNRREMITTGIGAIATALVPWKTVKERTEPLIVKLEIDKEELKRMVEEYQNSLRLYVNISEK
jgi:hypothetical protein